MLTKRFIKNKFAEALRTPIYMLSINGNPVDGNQIPVPLLRLVDRRYKITSFKTVMESVEFRTKVISIEFSSGDSHHRISMRYFNLDEESLNQLFHGVVDYILRDFEDRHRDLGIVYTTIQPPQQIPDF